MSLSMMQRRTSQKFYRTTEELTKPEESQLQGTIPNWLSGAFLRTGPGYFDFPDGFTVNHWLDGYAVISKFHVSGQSVKFEKKFFQSEAFKRAKKANKPCVCEYGTRAYSDPSRSWMSRLYNTIIPEFTDNANISIYNVGQNVFVSGETCYFYDLNVSNMTAGHKWDTNRVFGIHCASPHPLTDRNGYTYNIGSSYAPTLKYCFVKIPPTDHTKDPKEVLKKGKVLCTIPSRWNRNIMSYNHSFGLTENYIVFIEQPYVVSLNKILSSVLTKGQSFKDWVEWNPECKNRFYIIDKSSGKVVSNAEFMSEEAFFFVHMINCYEDNGQVVVTLSRYDSPEVLETQDLSILRQGGTDGDETRACGTQYVVPIDVNMSNVLEGANLVKVPSSNATAYKQGSQIILTPDVLTEKGLEFPAINKKFLGRKHRYYYASGLTSLAEYRNAVVKIDMVEKRAICWRDNANQVVGEPVFVPNPDLDYEDAGSEDDGVLICPVTDYREGVSDLIVFIDPKTMKELARAEFKTQIPPSIHGIFVPS
ncbi:Beta,beta-carotene 9',10'-oxygenase [Orchesella cincta]|uniref:Beta,beta-carotene 9',10'-oxygenase n=1 Tax=Orchesella cincta TaxID=48709 RepID=A0A1D2NAZ5_ORCCI|nr:Beta,beta-carotene 9',10'-oxygenase [Orchesella cincta]